MSKTVTKYWAIQRTWPDGHKDVVSSSTYRDVPEDLIKIWNGSDPSVHFTSLLVTRTITTETTEWEVVP